MSKLFAPSTPSFSQTSYSPLRNSQDNHFDDDEDEDDTNHHPLPSHNLGPAGSSPYRYHSPSSRRNSRSRPTSMTASSPLAQQQLPSTSASTSPAIHHHATAFSAGESSDSDHPVEIQPEALTDRSSRRASTIRPRSQSHSVVAPSPGSQTRAVIMDDDASSSIAASHTTGSTLHSPESPPLKYSAESVLEFSEPGRGRLGQDEELGHHHHLTINPGADGLLMQASTTLMIAVSGLICAGWLLDVIQHWQVFIDISELIILIPILLNLKGNLEMNLASRLSTAANMGLLDQKASRNAFIKGNLALLQLQSLTVGSVAGLFSFGLGMVVHPTTNNFNEIALMITASMLCAAMSSFVLGGFMCGLVLVCRRYRINPDNIACPLASSFGDLVTLVILAGCSVILVKYLDSPLSIILLILLLGLIPAWIVYVRKNKFVAEVVKEGWGPVFAAMVIASTAGLTLERYINEFPGMALISPVLNGLTGNIGSIYASRISTSLHANVKECYRATERTLFLVHIPVQIVFLIVIGAMGLGHIQWSVPVVLGYAVVALCLVVISLAMAKWITHLFWRNGYDPDNYALPILTSLIDVIGTGFLVLGFWALQYGKAYVNEHE